MKNLARWMVCVIACALVLYTFMTKEVSQLGDGEGPVAFDNHIYPYDDTEMPLYYGYDIGCRFLESGLLVYHEIGEEEMPVFRMFCADGDGKYFPMQALYNRYFDWFDLEVKRDNTMEDDFIRMSLFRTEEDTFLKPGQEVYYDELLEHFPAIELFCEEVFAMQQNGSCKDSMQVYLTDGEKAPTVLISTSIDYHEVCLVSAPELALLGDGTKVFTSYMKDICNSDGESQLQERDISVSYYYQEIHAENAYHNQGRFMYFAWWQEGGKEYLLQVTTPMFPVNGKDLEKAEGIDAFESVLTWCYGMYNLESEGCK